MSATCRSRSSRSWSKTQAELDGLPEDFIKAHKPAADGTITLTSDSPDVTPVLKFAKSADLRKRIYLAYNNRAYPQNVAVLADLLKKREELANLLGYKHWSDMNAADKMAVNAPNIAKFIGEIDVGFEARGRTRIQDAAGGGAETRTRRCNRSVFRTAAITSSNFAAASSISTRRRRGPTSPTIACS